VVFERDRRSARTESNANRRTGLLLLCCIGVLFVGSGSAGGLDEVSLGIRGGYYYQGQSAIEIGPSVTFVYGAPKMIMAVAFPDYAWNISACFETNLRKNATMLGVRVCADATVKAFILLKLSLGYHSVEDLGSTMSVTPEIGVGVFHFVYLLYGYTIESRPVLPWRSRISVGLTVPFIQLI